MIPITIKLVFWFFISLIVFFLIRNLIKDMKICPVCKKRMWFWQEVYFKKEKKPFFSIKRDVFTPERHTKCGYGK